MKSLVVMILNNEMQNIALPSAILGKFRGCRNERTEVSSVLPADRNFDLQHGAICDPGR